MTTPGEELGNETHDLDLANDDSHDAKGDLSKLTGLLSANLGADDGEDEADDDAPEKNASDKETDGDGKAKVEATDGDEKLVEAPASWDDASKAEFAKLPPALQQVIATREAESAKGVSTKVQEAEQARQAADADRQQVQQLRGHYEQQLMAAAMQLEGSVPEEFKAIKSPQDLLRIAKDDPALAQRFNAWREVVGNVFGQLSQLQAHRATEAEKAQSEHLAREGKSLAEKWPDFMHAEKGKALRSDLSGYLKVSGFNDKEIAGLADHRIVLVLRDALEGRKAAAALKTLQAKIAGKQLPNVLKPGKGADANAGRGNRDRSNGNLKEIARNGTAKDHERAFAQLLSS